MAETGAILKETSNKLSALLAVSLETHRITVFQVWKEKMRPRRYGSLLGPVWNWCSRDRANP